MANIDPAAEIRSLSYQIRGKRILNNVSMQINKGDVFGLVGDNGAGKTTLLKLILGIEPACQDRIRLFGSDRLPEQRRRIGTVMSLLHGDPSLRGKDYLREMCMLSGADPSTEIPRVADMAECTAYLGKRLNACSDGMYKRILIAGALTGSPELLVLDEPFNAIDPRGMEQLRIILSTLHRKGVTILVTSHILPELMKLATRFGVIYEGSMQFCGSTGELGELGFHRYLYETDSLAEAFRLLERSFPALCAIPYYDNQVAVIAREQPELPDPFRFCGREEPDAEEVLRFYMSGKGQMQ